MKSVEIRGIIPPIITPMNEDESINTQELRRQVRRQMEGGVHGIFCFGTNGEGYILEEKEKQSVLETVIDEVGGRLPVYAGTGCISTRETIRQSKMAQAAGADVLSIITPGFAAASQEELYQHYKAVAQAVELPIVLYNIPARTGNALYPPPWPGWQRSTTLWAPRIPAVTSRTCWPISRLERPRRTAASPSCPATTS